MITLLLQWTSVALLSCFAVVALLVGRRAAPTSSPLERAAWYVTGVVFAWQSVLATVQLSAGTAAFILGPESRWYAEYLRYYMPIGNHSRGMLTHCYYFTLAVLLAKGHAAIHWRTGFYALLAIGMITGGILGLLEGPLVHARHWMNIALSETLMFVALTAILFAALFRPLLDRWHWAALVVYGMNGALNSIYLAALAWSSANDVWTPAPWQRQAFRVVFHVGMVFLAVWRLRVGARGAPIPSLLRERRPAAQLHIR